MSVLSDIKAAGAILAGGGAGALPPTAQQLTPQRVVFAHAVNTPRALEAALGDPRVTALEGDVVVDGATGGAVMGHDPGAPHAGLAVAAWAEACAAGGRLAKVDIKQDAAVEGVLAALVEVENEAHRGGVPHWPLLRLDRPGRPGEYVTRPGVIVNADVLPATAPCAFFPGEPAPPGEAGREARVAAARGFAQRVWAALPSAVLSVGWATSGEGRAYAAGDVDDMLRVVGEEAACGAPVTFPVRGSYVVASWPHLRRLLDAGPFTSLTVWSPTPLPRLEEEWIRAHLPPVRTLYDLPARPAEGDAGGPAAAQGGGGGRGRGWWAAVGPGDQGPALLAAAAAGALLAAAVAWRALR